MKPLRHPVFWLVLWLLAVAAVVAGSLAPPSALPDAPTVNDKLVHVAMYFVLMAAAVQLFGRPGVLVAVAVALAGLGLAIEFAQGAFTTTRQFEWADAAANALGVLLGLALAPTPAARLLLVLERRLPPRRA